MRYFNDPRYGLMRVPSLTERRVEENLRQLASIGRDYHGLKCDCCSADLVRLDKIKIVDGHVLGPECSAPQHNFACKGRGAG